jgi:hypothetical protein
MARVHASRFASESRTEQSVYRAVRVTGADPATQPVGVAAAAATASPDAPLLDPATWAAEDTLWFTVAGHDGGTATISAGPATYGNFSSDVSAGTGGCGLGVARREVAVAAEDPPRFTLSAAAAWVAATVAVRPARQSYAFATLGPSSYEVALRSLLARRLQSTLVQSVVTVEDFIDFLEHDSTVARPVGDITIGSHGTDQGWLDIDLDVERTGASIRLTNPDEVADALGTHVLEIPAALTRSDTTFFIRGCKVGQNATFLRLFRTALGGRIPINAPVFFHQAWWDANGSYETFLYDYQITQLRPFASYAAALAAFHGAGFHLKDGSAVPAGAWRSWIPEQTFNREVDLHIPLRVSLGTFPGLPTTKDIERRYKHEIERTFGYDIGNTTLPATPAAQRQLLINEMSQDARFGSTAPWPLHTRFDVLGNSENRVIPCATITEFVDSFRWTLSQSGTDVHAQGERHKYVVGPPIRHPTSSTDPLPAGTVVFNFYPDPATGLNPVRQVQDSDPDYFATVP